jgi:hypothetical protein
MRGDDVSVGVESAFTWKVYSVSAHGKAPLLDFIRKALEARGCKIHHVSAANRAPFHIVFEMPGGERVSLLVYAFLANSKPTRNRPSDEHRFQIKYGGDLSGVVDVGVDPLGVTTTIFVGIDLKRKIFVAADPLMNDPSPCRVRSSSKRRTSNGSLPRAGLHGSGTDARPRQRRAGHSSCCQTCAPRFLLAERRSGYLI